MIVHFPNLDTLRLALTTGAVPADVAQKPATAGFGQGHELWVETSARLSAAAQRELKRLGAAVTRGSGAELSVDVSCWVELLPLSRDDVPPETLEQTPVLFEVRGEEGLSRLVLEMLRLGNDRQSYRWLEGDDDARALLRVVGPPYYSLLRALDQLGGPGVAPHAYVERAPGVWVELGYRHPLTANVKPPKGKLLLLRPPRHWLLLPDAPFRDVYEILDFRLPDGGAPWEDVALRERLRVAPRLRPAGPAEGAELWVLRGEAVAELDRFVQNADDALLGRLSFAVAEKGGQTLVVLRVRPSKQPPPVLVLPAEAYKSYLKIPNLFLPVGHILHPPLRRDVVRKLLAEDPRQITWLRPADGGSFTPEGLPDDVFRPLTDWVEYVLDRDREVLQAWVQAMQFEFEPFVCDEEPPPRPKKPPSAERERPPRRGPSRPADEPGDDGPEAEATPAEAEGGEDPTALEAFAAVEVVEPSALEKELRAAEEAFLALEGTLDDDAHRAQWPRLADLNARLNRTEDAGVCWTAALWEPDAAGESGARWAAAWFRGEATGAAHQQRELRPWVARLATPQGVRRDVRGDDLDVLLGTNEPTTADLRALAAYLAWSAHRQPRPAPLLERLAAVQRYLEKHEELLPVRACWLAWYHLAQMLDGDVLALARARDRLLERLFHNGLRPEQDLPGFLRFAGQPSETRFRGLGTWLEGLSERVGPWLQKQPVLITAVGKKPATAAYADLVFAFGLARLGEADAARRLLRRGQEALRREKKLAHDYLALAFGRRVEQALAGQPPVGALFTAEELDRLEEAEKRREEDQDSRRREGKTHQPGEVDFGARLIVDGMRRLSRVLEPHQRINPLSRYLQPAAEYEKVLAELPDVTDKKEIVEKIRYALQHGPKGENRQEIRIVILQAALDQAPRVHEPFACEMLDLALKAYDAGPHDTITPEMLIKRAALLQKSLFVAGHFDRTEHVQAFVGRFQAMLRSQFHTLLERTDSTAIEVVDALAGYCLYGLRKLGLRAEIERLLAQITDTVLGGRGLAEVASDRRNWALVRALLPVAGGRYYFGRDDQAEPVFQAARALLLQNVLPPKEQTALACTYAAALGQAPVAVAQERLAELLERLDGIADSFLTMDFFSQFQLRVLEAVVLAVVSDDFTQGSQARRWLDEHEYLVRRRIHADVRAGVSRET